MKDSKFVLHLTPEEAALLVELNSVNGKWTSKPGKSLGRKIVEIGQALASDIGRRIWP